MTKIDELHRALRSDGYVVARKFFTPDELSNAGDQLYTVLPSVYQHRLQRESRKYFIHHDLPFGGAGFGLANLTVAPKIVRLAQTILRSDAIYLLLAVAMAKYGGGDPDEFEQELHSDYPNMTMAYPSLEAPFGSVEMIVYLSDVADDQGPTCVVPWSVTGSNPTDPRVSRSLRPDWYDQEYRVKASAGDVLIYTLGTYHRGSAYRASDGARYTLHLHYRHANNLAVGWGDWSRRADRSFWNRWLSQLSPEQRTVLGFPEVGSKYWTSRTLAGVQARYPTMDLDPYRPAPGNRRFK